MKRKTKVIITLSLVLGISLLASGSLILASSMEMFMFVESLKVEEFKPENDDSYVADVLDSGVRVANIYIRAEHPRPQTLDVPVLISIWHSKETELDSLLLKLYAETGHIEVYLKNPTGSWPPIRFCQTPDAKGATIEVYDLGFQGTGTVTLSFLLGVFSDQRSFNFEVKFSMHEKAFLQLTRQEAWAYTEIPIPT